MLPEPTNISEGPSVLCPQLCWLWLVIVRVNCLTIYLSNLYHVVIMTVPGSCCLLNYCYEPSFSLLISDPCMNTRFAFLGADFYEQFKCNKLPGLPGPDTRLGTLNISRITPGVVIFRPLMSPRRGSVMILSLVWTAWVLASSRSGVPVVCAANCGGRRTATVDKGFWLKPEQRNGLSYRRLVSRCWMSGLLRAEVILCH